MYITSTEGCSITIAAVSMPKAVEEGRSPGIRVFQRTWNDENIGARITMKQPSNKVNFYHFDFIHYIQCVGSLQRPDILCSCDVHQLHG